MISLHFSSSKWWAFKVKMTNIYKLSFLKLFGAEVDSDVRLSMPLLSDELGHVFHTGPQAQGQ